MNIFIPLLLATQLFGGTMERTELSKDIYLVTWESGGKHFARIEKSGVCSPTETVATIASNGSYVSVKAIDANFARATYSDGTTKILHIVDGCVTVLEEGEKKQ